MAQMDGRRRPVRSALAAYLALVALALIQPQPSRADDPQERLITVQSIWSQADAIQRASAQLPRGAVVTRTRCTEVNVRTGNYRYICTLTYRPGAPDPAAPAP